MRGQQITANSDLFAQARPGNETDIRNQLRWRTHRENSL